MQYWVNHQHTLGLSYDAETFNMPDAQYWIEKMREDLEAGDAAKVLIKAPEIFKKDSDWCPWSETLLTYL